MDLAQAPRDADGSLVHGIQVRSCLGQTVRILVLSCLVLNLKILLEDFDQFVDLCWIPYVHNPGESHRTYSLTCEELISFLKRR